MKELDLTNNGVLPRIGSLFEESEMARLIVPTRKNAIETLSAHKKRKRRFALGRFLEGGRPSGTWGILKLNPCKTDAPPDVVLPFHKAVTLWRRGRRQLVHAVVHFFEEDYFFERLWNNPVRYLDMLRHFKYVIMPDFSMRMLDRPIDQVKNLDRSHLIGHWLQHNGVNVVPSGCWCGGASYSWCFSGLPDKGTIAISMTGCMGNDMEKSAFISGLKAFFEHTHPDVVWLFGYNHNQEMEDIISSHCKYFFINTSHYGKQS